MTNPTERELSQIRTLFLRMSVRAESMVRLAVRAAVERDPPLARSVLDVEVALDQLEVKLDRLCLRCLALHQPVGADLRLVTAVLKMVTDVERIGDLSCHIAEAGLELAGGGGVEPHQDLARMGTTAATMVAAATDALVFGNSSINQQLQAHSLQIETLRKRALDRWLEAVRAYPDQAERALALTAISRYLARIADHAVNLGQHVALLGKGSGVRQAVG